VTQLHRIRKERGDHRVLAVEAGQVVCPRQGVVDMERCWVCPAYDGLSAGRIEGVVCAADLAELTLFSLPVIR
jgi:hypothetical protein